MGTQMSAVILYEEATYASSTDSEPFK